MTIEELTELFIHAAEVDRRLPDTARPAKLKAMAIPYVYDYKDMAGWGSERLQEERQSFWDSRSTRLKTSDISDWERANELMVLVDDESQRRCLWHWSTAKAGGRPFSKWCRDREHIHAETGRRRKDRALFSILMRINCVNGNSTHEITIVDVLPVGTEISDKNVNIGNSWMADGTRPMACDFDTDLGGFQWAEQQNARRREREKKRKADHPVSAQPAVA